MDISELIKALNALQTLGIALPNLSAQDETIAQKILSCAGEKAHNMQEKSQIAGDGSIGHAVNPNAGRMEEGRISQVVTPMVPDGVGMTKHNAEEDSSSLPKKSFADVLCGEAATMGTPLNLAPIRVEGGNVIIEVDEEEIEKEVMLCSYDIIGRVVYQKGDRPLSATELQSKLQTLWKIPKVDIAHIGKGYYHVFLRNADYQSLVMSLGTQNLKPGFFRVSRWVKDFNPHNQKQTNAQCWVRIYDLPIIKYHT